jgi:phosphodiesterase/alkaline phosphatase D-like protein
MRLGAACLLAGALFAGTWVALSAHPACDPPPPSLPNGVAVGDASQTSAILWTRDVFTGTATLRLRGDRNARETRTALRATRVVTDTLDDLRPGVRYAYVVTSSVGAVMTGTFRTPFATGRHGLRFGVSGDGRGDLAPFPAIADAAGRELDFFVELGDTVYADVPSPALPITQATTLDEFRLKHQEVYATHHGLNAWADLRASTAVYAVIDDHEVTDDFAGGADVSSDSRFTETTGLINESALYRRGVQAFHEYNPLWAEFYGDVGDPRLDGKRKFYRYRTFGQDAALLLLDARSFRDEEIAPLDPDNQLDILRFLNQAFGPGRTMLGGAQLAQLKADLLDAQAQGITWKFVAVPEPIQNLGPAGGQDRFEGYAAERAELLRFIREQGIQNVVFVAADVHGSIVNNLTYQERAGLTEPQQPVDAFEVTTGPVAYDAPFGPTVVELAAELGLISPADKALYDSLPVAPDPDDVMDDKDDFVKSYVNQALAQLGYDPVGLDGSSIDARLLEGDYMAVHNYGWTEFEIDAASQLLTVTAYGVPIYTAAEMAADPAGVIGRAPAIVSRFVVTPAVMGVGFNLYLPLVQGE